MSSGGITSLSELSLTTALNNLLDLLDNRIAALDHEIEHNDVGDMRSALTLCIRIAADHGALWDMIEALQRVNVFYARYKELLHERIVQRLERNYLTYLRNKIYKAMLTTMHKLDTLAIKVSENVLTKQNVIKHRLSLSGKSINEFKKEVRELK